MHLKFRDADRHDLRVLLGSFYTLVDPAQPLDPLLQRRKRGRAAGAAGRSGSVHLLRPDPGGESGRETRPGVSLGRVLFLGPGASWPQRKEHPMYLSNLVAGLAQPPAPRVDTSTWTEAD